MVLTKELSRYQPKDEIERRLYQMIGDMAPEDVAIDLCVAYVAQNL